VPLSLQLINLVFGGGPIAWHLVADDAPWASVFGAAAAAGSIALACRAAVSPHGSRPEQLERQAR
jgi:hypothetical protein